MSRRRPRARSSRRFRRPLTRKVGFSHGGRELGFESLEGRLLLAADFGDAPASYGTLLVDNGARHEAVGPTLGELRSVEADGAPSAQADGDGVSDDGVAFGVLRAGDLGATLVVNVRNAPAGAKLDAWIDFNRDGHWASAGERIATSLAVAEGDNVVTFAIPAGASLGETFARFRVSVAGGLGPRGAAVDGEVEDYAVTIEPPVGSGYFDPTRPLADGVYASNMETIVTADLDGDGDLDVVAMSSSGSVSWQENDGQGVFTDRSLPGMYGGAARSLQVVDLDGDGDVDVYVKVGQYQYWMRNNGDKTFTGQILPNANVGAFAPVIVDFDGDGDLDIISTSYYTFGASGVFVQENNGTGSFTGRQLISDYTEFTSLSLLDDDGDGDLDIFLGARNSTMLYRYSNRGDGTYEALPPLTFASGGLTNASLTAIDFDQDGDVDLVATQGSYSLSAGVSQTVLSWYENLGDRAFALHQISAGVGNIRQVAIADVDGDGDLDAVASYVEQGQIVWHENLGGERFTSRELAQAPWRPGQPTTNRSQGVALGDVDGDGDLDVLMASTAEHRLRWLAQFAPPPDDYGDAPAPYPTGFSANGARHAPVGPTLGPARDADAGPMPSAGADGDGADDDGVIVTPIRVGQLGATWSVQIENAPAGARLDAWIDFDGDGNWSRADERVATNWVVVEGENLLTFNVPVWAAAGVTYARFRVSTAGGLGFAGAAADGEVEDYAVVIEPPVAAIGRYFEYHSINQAAAPASVTARSVVVDLDRDGDNDLVSPASDGRTLAWYENDGQGGYVERVIAPYLSSLPIHVIDLDADGDLDVVVRFGIFGDAFINDGAQNFAASPLGIPIWAPTSYFHEFVDVEGDGDVDILITRGLLENQRETAGRDAYYWMGSNSTLPQAYGGFAVDGDGDGQLDLIGIAIASNGRLDWKPQRLKLFETINYFETGLTSGSVYSAPDVNGDGHLDLLVVQGSPLRVTMLVNNGHGGFETVDVGSLDSAGVIRSANSVDLDGDGDLDFLVSTTAETSWFENLGGFQFAKHRIAAGGAVSLGDMDGDGRLDVIVGTAAPGDAYGGGWGWYSLVERRVSIAADRVVVDEEASEEIVFTFTREGDASESTIISFNIAGTATYGVDYLVEGAAEFNGETGSVYFPPNVTSVEVRLTPIDDAIKELDETAILSLVSLDGYAIGAGAATATIRSAELGGDFNDDGVVDGGDFLAWQRSFGQAAEPAGTGADGDLSGMVDGDDLAMWKANFGRQASPVEGANLAMAAAFAIEEEVISELQEKAAPFIWSMTHAFAADEIEFAVVDGQVHETTDERHDSRLAGVVQLGLVEEGRRGERHFKATTAAVDEVFARGLSSSTAALPMTFATKKGAGLRSRDSANNSPQSERVTRLIPSLESSLETTDDENVGG